LSFCPRQSGLGTVLGVTLNEVLIRAWSHFMLLKSDLLAGLTLSHAQAAQQCDQIHINLVTLAAEA